jgi:hypothetical protein
VSLDNLAGESLLKGFDKKSLNGSRNSNTSKMIKRKTIIDLIDTYISDAKARKAYA